MTTGLQELFVPTLLECHPDELYMSLCNRLWRRSGERSSDRFSFSVNRGDNTSYFLFRRAPQGLDVFAQMVGLDTASLIERHTLIPYFEFASPVPLSNEQYSALASNGHSNSRYRLNSWKGQPLQWCLKCVREDVERLGEPIWHCSHQLPGVTVCAVHKQWLTRECPTCAWRPSMRSVSYPARRCPNGHDMRTASPNYALRIGTELSFAHWSRQLLSYRFGDRRAPLLQTLRGLAASQGLRPWRRSNPFDDLGAMRLLRRHKHRVLDHALCLLTRISNGRHSHVLDPALRANPQTRPHPVAVLLCVKALAGPHCNPIEVLRDAQPSAFVWDGAGPLTWRERWEMLPTNATERRVKFLAEFFEERARGTRSTTVRSLDEELGAELGLTGGAIHRYRVLFPELSHLMQQSRPDLGWRAAVRLGP